MPNMYSLNSSYNYGNLDRLKKVLRSASLKANEDSTLQKLDLYPLYSLSFNYVALQLSDRA